MASTEYIPGVCNLGRAEIRARWIAAWLGIGITLGCLLLFALVEVPWYFKVLVFLPASLGAAGVLQAVSRFCVKFGFQGVFNFGPDVGKTDTVEQAEFRRKDRQKAIQISVTGLALAAAVTAFALICL
jgi:hypothetical protein